MSPKDNLKVPSIAINEDVTVKIKRKRKKNYANQEYKSLMDLKRH